MFQGNLAGQKQCCLRRATHMGSRNGKAVLSEEDIATLVTSSGLDEEQIQSRFDKFVEKHRDGTIKPNDFHKMMSKAFPKTV